MSYTIVLVDIIFLLRHSRGPGVLLFVRKSFQGAFYYLAFYYHILLWRDLFEQLVFQSSLFIEKITKN